MVALLVALISVSFVWGHYADHGSRFIESPRSSQLDHASDTYGNDTTPNLCSIFDNGVHSDPDPTPRVGDRHIERSTPLERTTNTTIHPLVAHDDNQNTNDANATAGNNTSLNNTSDDAGDGDGNGEEEPKAENEGEAEEMVYSIILAIAIALLAAKLFGSLFVRINQPSVIGEILSGIIVGPFVFGMLNGAVFHLGGLAIGPIAYPDFNSHGFNVFSTIGIMFLLFLSGLETDISDIRKSSKIAFSTAIAGVALPFFFGFLTGQFFGFTLHASLAAGAIFTATSVGVTAMALINMNQLKSDVGVVILATAVIDDVIAIIVLTVVLGTGALHWLAINIVVFFFIALYIGLRIIGRIMDLGDRLDLPKGIVTFALFIAFIYSVVAWQIGIAAITGAFVAGLIIGKTQYRHRVTDDIKTIGYTFFIPLFFVHVGASIDIGMFPLIGPMAALFIPAAIAGKIIGCGVGATIGGMDIRNSIMVGVGMIPKMEVALIIVTTAIAHGVFDFRPGLPAQMLGLTVLHVCVTTFLAPVLLKFAFQHDTGKEQDERASLDMIG